MGVSSASLRAWRVLINPDGRTFRLIYEQISEVKIMPSNYPKACRERRERYINSLQENAPTEEFGDVTLVEIKADHAEIDGIEDEIALSKAHTKRLETQRDDKNKASMKKLDYVTDGVVGDRRFGPDSPLYEGFGYIRESEKKKPGGGKKPAPNP